MSQNQNRCVSIPAYAGLVACKHALGVFLRVYNAVLLDPALVCKTPLYRGAKTALASSG